MVEYSQATNIRRPLSSLGLKGQLRGYQNPERSVTGADWQRGPLKRSCDPLTNHRTALATQIQQERTGSSRPPTDVPPAKAKQKP